mgnify:CR=1 FL=1
MKDNKVIIGVGGWVALWTLCMLAWTPSQAAAQSAGVEAQSEDGPVGWFVAPHGRLMATGNRVSHAWGVEGGVTLWDWVNVGAVFYQRSGPVNAEDFQTDLPEGITYKGKSRLELGSEFVFMGLQIAPQIPIGLEDFSLEVPLAFGSGGAGFYLKGSDRDTPDGRRVSEWENELFEGRDFADGLGWEVGLRGVWKPTDEDWFRLAAGVHYTSVDFDAFARQAPFYDGLSMSVSVMLGRM